jgi:hypothetical protein
MTVNEKVELIEKQCEAYVQYQSESMEHATRRDETESLLVESERVFHEHRKNPTIQASEPPVLTPLEVLIEEVEQAPLR